MQSLYIHGSKDIRLDERPAPVAGDYDVVLRTQACGVCGTDIIAVRAGTRRLDGSPMPLGHEVSAVVDTVGMKVTGIRPGMRVVLDPMAKVVARGVAASEVIGCGGSEGAFGRTFLVRDAVLGADILELPPQVSFAHAALTDPLGVAAHAIARGQAKAGERVVVFGAGPIGLAAVIWLRRIGVTNIVSIDMHEGRLKRARALGAAATIDASREDVLERLSDAHGASRHMGVPVVGTDLFIELAGGTGVIQRIIDIGAPQARLVIVAVHHGLEPINFEMLLIKELVITSAIGYPTELPEVVAALPELTHKLDIIISHRFPFGQVFDAFAVAGTGESSKVLVTFDG
jgi:(R,R)-butanediol dehydrogenase/meso-butanediol dehydrogenase/diacetyl reductase